MPGIKDKVVVITGASSGIGEATQNFARGKHAARRLSSARELDRLEALARRIAGTRPETANGNFLYTLKKPLRPLLALWSHVHFRYVDRNRPTHSDRPGAHLAFLLIEQNGHG